MGEVEEFGLHADGAWVTIKGWGLYQARRRAFEHWLLDRPASARIARYVDVSDGHWDWGVKDLEKFAKLPDFVQATMCGEWEGDQDL